jgi:hypothetical protein
MTDEPIATLTLTITYFRPHPGDLTSKLEIRAIESSIDLGARDSNAGTVWGADETERDGAELHREIIALAEFILEPWTDAAERLQVAAAKAMMGPTEE